jgi:diguanylate cyclase (GGDEF)-like protein
MIVRVHSAGDACLNRVVNTIGTILGNRGNLYRWGSGDEFVALLPYVTTDEAKATAERIRSSIEQAGKGQVQVTASIGICATDQAKTDSAEEILKLADQAIYQSKHSGKNRVTS